MAGETEAAISGNLNEFAALTRNLGEVLNRESGGAAEAAQAIAIELAQEIQTRIAIVGPPPSAPGESPHIDSGALYDAFDPEVAVEVTQEPGGIFSSGNYQATVGTDLEYAPYLEFGTSQMQARPYFRPAIESIIAVTPNIVGDHLGESASGASSGTSSSSISASLPFTPA